MQNHSRIKHFKHAFTHHGGCYKRTSSNLYARSYGWATQLNIGLQDATVVTCQQMNGPAFLETHTLYAMSDLCVHGSAASVWLSAQDHEYALTLNAFKVCLITRRMRKTVEHTLLS